MRIADSGRAFNRWEEWEFMSTENIAAAVDDTSGLTPKQIADFERLKAAREAANAEPLPGPLAEGLAPGPITVHGIVLQPLTAGHLLTLKLINSPLRRAVLGEKAELAEEDIITCAFILSQPTAKIRLLAQTRPGGVMELAMMELGDRMSPAMVAELMEAIRQVFQAGFSTAIVYRGKAPEGEVVFPKPGPETGSAGSLT